MRRTALKAIHGTVRITRDSQGVPRVQAGNWADAFFALGWLHARDRGAQIFLMRTVAQGRICELLRDDDDLLEVDVYFRRFGFARDAQRHIAELQPPYAENASAYADGVNASWQARRPPLLRLLGLTPEPFKPADILLSAKLMSFAGLAEGQRIGELFIIEALRRGVEVDKLTALLPTLDSVDGSLIRSIRAVPPLFPGARAESRLPVNGGSNAWVVAAHRSQSGAPLLASDPHLEINRLPALFYEAELCVDEDWVKGATIPGTYSFVIARTPRLTWGVTYSCADTSDFFVERCKNGRYLRDGTWNEFLQRNERVLRQHHPSHSFPVFETSNGILETDDADVDGDHLCWNWVGLGRGGLGVLQSLVDLIHCDSVEQAQKTVRRIDIPTLHMVFADAQDNIGYQFVGTIPKRREGWSGLAPGAGWITANGWRGYLDPEQDLPAELNPPSGQIVITNEARQCPGGPRLATLWLSDYRHLRIEQLLAGRDELQPQDMQRVQYDILSLQVGRFLEEYLRHIPDGTRRQSLQDWDGRYATDSVAAALFEAIHLEVVIEVFGAGGFGRDWMRYLLEQTCLYVTLIGYFDDVLAQADSLWLPADERAARIEAGVRRGLERPGKPWGVQNQVVFSNLMLGGRLPRFLGFDRGPKPLQGNHATVHQGSLLNLSGHRSSFAPAYHFVTDLAGAVAWTNLPGGPSESRFSDWYVSDLRRWLRGEYKSI